MLKSWLRSIDWLAINTSALVLVVALCLLPAPSNSAPHQQACGYQKACENTQGNPSLLEGFAAWVETHHDGVEAGSTLAVAGFTLLLFVSTLGLWIQTRGAAREGRDSLKIVERAYLFFDFDDTCFVKTDDKFEITLRMHNSGKTPGTIYEVYGETGDTIPAKRSYVRPKCLKNILERISPNNPGTIGGITANGTYPYIFGYVKYRDVFGESRSMGFALKQVEGLAPIKWEAFGGGEWNYWT